jgi:hypothetical protein
MDLVLDRDHEAGMFQEEINLAKAVAPIRFLSCGPAVSGVRPRLSSFWLRAVCQRKPCQHLEKQIQKERATIVESFRIQKRVKKSCVKPHLVGFSKQGGENIESAMGRLRAFLRTKMGVGNPAGDPPEGIRCGN